MDDTAAHHIGRLTEDLARVCSADEVICWRHGEVASWPKLRAIIETFAW